MLSWAYMFFLGACCYLLSDKIILSIPLFLTLRVLAVIVHFKLPFSEYFFYGVLMYGIVVFAYHPMLQVKGFYKLSDCSYGLYIYAFPIQQLVRLKFPELNPIPHFLISFLITFPIALLHGTLYKNLCSS
jgi:peptidoglycan/LPS O-acetylase OafA/YrhL